MRIKPIWGLKSPAAIAHDGKCQEVMIDPLIWWMFNPQERKFIIEHELAHCHYNVYDEFQADRIGFQEFVEDGGDPQAAISALQSLGDSPFIQSRIEALKEENMHWFQKPALYNVEPHYSFFGPDSAWGYGNDGASGNGGRWGPEQIGDLAGELGDIFASIIAAKNGRYYPHSQYPQGYPQQQNNTLIWVVLAVVILLLVFVLIKNK